MTALPSSFTFLTCSLVVLLSPIVRAETLEAPIGGRPSPLGDDRVACAPPAGGRSLDPSRALGNGGGSPFGFIFGPSITIGNVGTNL